jgi:hypothetical protein
MSGTPPRPGPPWRRLPRRRLLAAASGLPLLAACAGSPPTRLHLLAVEPEGPLEGVRRSPPIALGVGPLEVVDYLERPEIVTRRGRTSLALAELDRWGERFEVMFGRVLRESLARLLATDAVVELPTDRDVQPELRLALQLLRFEAEETGEVVLEARWQLLGRTGDRPLRLERTRVSEPVAVGPATDGIAAAGGMEGVVAAMSRALGELARQLAAAVAAEDRARARRPAAARPTAR